MVLYLCDYGSVDDVGILEWMDLHILFNCCFYFVTTTLLCDGMAKVKKIFAYKVHGEDHNNEHEIELSIYNINNRERNSRETNL